MMLEINNIRYSVDLHQEDPGLPYLILLHGFMGSYRVFEHLLPGLKELCNPITVDLLGHGKTESPALAERFSSPCQVKDLDDVIGTLDRSPVILHGYSMGGRLALRYATLHPEKLSGLILESANPGIREAVKRADRIETDERQASAIEADYISFLEEWEQLPLFRNGVDVPENRMERYRNVQQSQNPEAMAACLRLFGTGMMPHAWDTLERMPLPVLLIAGEADAKYCTICEEMSKLLPDSTFHKIEKAGHRVHLENPAAFVNRVKSFINSQF